MTTKFTNFINKLSNLETDKKVQFYILLFIILLSFSTLIPNMTLKIPCNNVDNASDCSLLGEVDSSGLIEYKTPKYLGLYSMNIITGCLCFILSFVLLYYVLK